MWIFNIIVALALSLQSKYQVIGAEYWTPASGNLHAAVFEFEKHCFAEVTGIEEIKSIGFQHLSWIVADSIHNTENDKAVAVLWVGSSQEWPLEIPMKNPHAIIIDKRFIENEFVVSMGILHDLSTANLPQEVREQCALPVGILGGSVMAPKNRYQQYSDPRTRITTETPLRE